jgi:hypothetical protein
MEAICSSETLVATQQTIQCYRPEDDTLHNHRCENLKSYIYRLFLLDAVRCQNPRWNLNLALRHVPSIDIKLVHLTL